MSPELYTIIGVAIALAGLIINSHRSLSASMAQMRKEHLEAIGALRTEYLEGIGALRTEYLEGIGALRTEYREAMGELRTEHSEAFGALRTERREATGELRRDLGALGERVARVEGLLEGLRDAITGKAA